MIILIIALKELKKKINFKKPILIIATRLKGYMHTSLEKKLIHSINRKCKRSEIKEEKIIQTLSNKIRRSKAILIRKNKSKDLAY